MKRGRQSATSVRIKAATTDLVPERLACLVHVRFFFTSLVWSGNVSTRHWMNSSKVELRNGMPEKPPNIGSVEVQLNPSRMLVSDKDVSVLYCDRLWRRRMA